MDHTQETFSLFDRYVDQVRYNKYISVRGQYEGLHAYENAPEEVAFLRNNHRHLFKWRVQAEVFHNDRELEFFMLKDMIEREILPYTRMMSNLGSCEQQAERILKGLITAYGPDRYYLVDISEDGESDGTVEWCPDS